MDGARQQLLDAALLLARDRHWEEVRLADVAEAAGMSLRELRAHFPDKEAFVDALWDRADDALLAAANDEIPMATGERIERLVFAWLQPLAAHRRTARQMLLVRLEPGHLHIQLPTLIRISRTVQWLREAARLEQGFLMRALDETALTALFAATVALWLRDDNDAAARDLLRRGLALRKRLVRFPR